MHTSKTRYFLIEIVVNCLFFAIAAAVCLNLFVSGYIQSRESRTLSMAALEAQNVAEIAKASDGDLQKLGEMLGVSLNDTFILYYNEEWVESSEDAAAYKIVITPNTSENIFTAHIEVFSDESIYTLEAVKYVGEVAA